jgi:hypothetical protein
MKVKKLTSIATCLLLTGGLFGARLNPESYYQEIAAKKYNGETEVTMPDGTRCDIVTEKHAIEVDSADKWGKPSGRVSMLTHRKVFRL